VNVSLVIYAPALDSDDLYFMRGRELKLLSEAVDEEEQSARSSQSNHSEGDNGDRSSSHKRFSRLVVWKSNVTGVNENIYAGPVSDLPSGLYTLVLVVKSPRDDDNYYRWVTHIAIP
jgi:hypothetical protein